MKMLMIGVCDVQEHKIFKGSEVLTRPSSSKIMSDIKI